MDKLGVDGVSVLVNDVERWRGYLDEDPAGEFTWHRHGHAGLELHHTSSIDGDFEVPPSDLELEQTHPSGEDKPETLFFRFAFLRGAEAGKYGSAGIWLEEGDWISPPPPKS
jgi:hypothetical protein